jgi:hypothetical protein
MFGSYPNGPVIKDEKIFLIFNNLKTMVSDTLPSWKLDQNVCLID